MMISTDALVFACGMSRSGTTLLATILDSHSRISMGYELIPPEFPSITELRSHLEQGLEISQNDFSKCGQVLRKTGFPNEGLFFTRCYRAGIDALDLQKLFVQLQESGFQDIRTFRQRLEVAWRIAKRSAEKRERHIYGFKLNIPSVEKTFEYFPNSRMLYILRDPRDVVASHIERKFNRTIPEICKAWNNYIQSFDNFMATHSGAGMALRYEDIVSDSAKSIPVIFDFLKLTAEAAVFAFYRSKAGIHTFGHPNAENLKLDFFTTSIGRWRNELGNDQIVQIEKICHNKMGAYGYLQKN